MSEKEVNKSENINKNVEIVCKETGWSLSRAKEEMNRARENGMSYYRYAYNKCWKMTDEEIKKLAVKLEEQAKIREEKIAAVCKETGWSQEHAKKEMDRAKKNGMPYYRYLNNECWKLNDEEIKELAIKLEKQAQEKIETVCEATGWSLEKAKEELAKANKKGITSKKYIEKSMYDLSDAEIDEFARILEKRKLIWKKNYKFYLDVLCNSEGWDYKKAEKELERAKEYDLTYLKFMQLAGWKCKDKQMDKIVEQAKIDSQRIQRNKKIYIQKICDATGWSKGKAELEVNRSKNECGSSYEDYYLFQFYKIPIEEQKKYVTLDLFNKMRLKYNDHQLGNEIFDNKANFNHAFKDMIHRRWFTNRKLTYEEFLQYIDGLDAVLAKELIATQGIGVYKFKVNESSEANKKAYKSIMGLKESIIEQYIVQHEEVMKFCPTSVNTVRVTTLNYQGECRFLYSVFRMGRGDVVDNFHAGGIAASIDIETGIVSTDAVDLEGNVYEYHPYSGLKIKGFQIPHWDKIVETCKKVTGRVQGVNLVGWDFAITSDGVDLIEGNPGASYVVAQIPNVKDRVGLRSVMVDPYL